MQALQRYSSKGTLYSDAQMAALMVAQTGTERWFFELLNPDFSFRYDLTPYVNFDEGTAQISHDATADGKREAQFLLRGDAPINVLSDLVYIMYAINTPDGGFATYPMGVFTISPYEKTIRPGSTWRRMVCPDLSQLLIDSTLTSTFSVYKNGSYGAAIRALCATYGGLTPIYVSIPEPSAKIPENFSWEYGTTRLKVINDLLAAVNYWPAYFNETGVLVSRPKPDFNSTVPSFIFDSTPKTQRIVPVASSTGLIAGELVESTVRYFATVEADSPVAYYRLGDFHAIAEDESANLLNGVIRGGVIRRVPGGVAGDLDAAMTFDGTSGRIDIPFNAILNPAVVSLEMLVYVPSLPAANVTIFNSIGSNRGYRLQLLTSGAIRWVVGSGAATPSITSGVLALNTWHHVVAYCDGVNGSIWIDGILAAGPSALTMLPNTTSDSHIASFDGTSSFYAGTLDEVAIYGYVLTPIQIANHYNSVIFGPSAKTNTSPIVQSSSIVMIPIRDSPDVSKIYNQCLVVIEDPRRNPTFAFYQNIAKNNPVSVYNWHPKTKVIKHSQLPFGETAYGIARAFVQQSSLLFSSIEVNTFPWAVSQDYDFYQLRYMAEDEGYIDQKYIEVKWVHRMKTGLPTTHTFQTVLPT